MNNATLFKYIFGIYAEEFWSMPFYEMSAWLVADAPTVSEQKGDTEMITNRLYHNPEGYEELKRDNGKMTKDKIASRLGWIKDNLAWLGPEGTREQIEMLIADILREKKGDS